MNEIEQGGCACGALRYTLKAGYRLKPYACHCSDCQKRTGSAFSHHMLVMRSDLELTGDLDQARMTQPSGAVSTISGCPQCKSRIMAENSTRPGTAALRVGTLDRAVRFPPAAHIWVSSKHPWLVLPDDVPQLDEQPRTNEEWMQLLGPQ